MPAVYDNRYYPKCRFCLPIIRNTRKLPPQRSVKPNRPSDGTDGTALALRPYIACQTSVIPYCAFNISHYFSVFLRRIAPRLILVRGAERRAESGGALHRADEVELPRDQRASGKFGSISTGTSPASLWLSHTSLRLRSSTARRLICARRL